MAVLQLILEPSQLFYDPFALIASGIVALGYGAVHVINRTGLE